MYTSVEQIIEMYGIKASAVCFASRPVKDKRRAVRMKEQLRRVIALRTI